MARRRAPSGVVQEGAPRPWEFPMRSRFPVLALAAAALAACNNGPSYPGRAASHVTVEGGGTAPAFADLASARAAFSRTDGAMTAVLEDASWLRLEGDPATAAERHPEYFAGLTTFEVALLTEHFARPTDEDYLLEDSTGARATAKPSSYKSDVKGGFGPRNYATFTLAFRHTLSKSVRWLRLSRAGEGGGHVQWDFPGA